MDIAGHFWQDGGGRASKQGTVNTAAGAENNDAPKEEDGEEGEDTSKLTLSSELLPTYREFLKLTRHISASVGVMTTESEQDCVDEENSDGNELSDLGFRFLKISNETQDVPSRDQGAALAIKEDW